MAWSGLGLGNLTTKFEGVFHKTLPVHLAMLTTDIPSLSIAANHKKLGLVENHHTRFVSLMSQTELLPTWPHSNQYLKSLGEISDGRTRTHYYRIKVLNAHKSQIFRFLLTSFVLQV